VKSSQLKSSLPTRNCPRNFETSISKPGQLPIIKMDMVPVILGQYRLGKTIGIGSFGKVKCEYKECDLLFKIMSNLHVIVDTTRFI
jgi:hypothetical protein